MHLTGTFTEKPNLVPHTCAKSKVEKTACEILDRLYLYYMRSEVVFQKRG
jgi:hypothetical protein